MKKMQKRQPSLRLGGVYHYRVMPFGLINAGATYMSAMTTIFHDMIHKEIEVYVDDVIVKSHESSDHLTHLRKFFDRLRRYNLKLNPVKCAFGVPAGNLLGFIVSMRGIELDPSKIKTIQELPPPKIKKEEIKAQALADHLVENPVDEEYKPLKTYFPNKEAAFVGEDISEAYPGWRVFFDGAANHQGKGIRVVLVSESSQHYPMAAKLRFYCMNNMAEYEACILGLKMAIDMNVHELLVIGDSDLLIHHVQGHWVVKNPKITMYMQYIQKLCKRFCKIEFRHTPRTHNELADALATIASMIKHPDTSYIDPLDIEIYAGVCGTHMNGLTLARKILRAGYFWMTMEHDCCKLVQKCHKCQVHGDLIRVSPHELNAMSSPWPFVAWGMDVLGPIEPTAFNRHIFILVAIVALPSGWKKLRTSRFGVSKSIITNNGANLNSMREIYEQFRITHRYSTIYRPQMNGAIEAAKKNIKKILRKMIDNHRGWHEMLPYALLGYRTTVRTSVGATPYLLVYGTEAVIPAEVEIPSLRIIQEAELSDVDWVRNRIDQLTLIDEKRMVADEYKGKFAPNWQGPYMVRKVLSGGALVLSEMDGTEAETNQLRCCQEILCVKFHSISLPQQHHIPPFNEQGEVKRTRSSPKLTIFL
ncbi:uncharacterized protein [Solanum tuberosum]|uniref:uncharacterized protein n=1 Tax=Solanum tuberosum TaxID=4113 RepID=UPI00073A122C|nr:PREDICTED: uncharacterized protein LOC107058529 [Solanum tuberosum]